MRQVADDEDVTVVTIIPDPAFKQEVTIVSDATKSPRFPTLQRPALMVMLVVGTAALGAVGGHYLQSGKAHVDEENHATVNEHPHDDESTITMTATESTAETIRLTGAGTSAAEGSQRDPFSDEALGLIATVDDERHTNPVTDDSSDPVLADPETPFLALSSQDTELPPDAHEKKSSSELPNRSQHEPSPVRSASPMSPSAQERITQQAVNLMAAADEDLAGGNYVQAMQAYQSLRQKSDGATSPAVLFRLALCAEGAGRHAAAIEAYRRISGTQADPAWAGVARYGEARCLSVMKRYQGLQTDLLRRAILDETEFLPTVRGEVLHLIGRDLWREQAEHAIVNLLDDQTLVVPDWSADPARLLNELPMLIHETPPKSRPPEFRVTTLQDANPDKTLIRLYCGRTEVATLLHNVMRRCQLNCDFSEAAQETLRGRTQQVNVTEQSLAMFLDAITISSGVAWQMNGSTVHILHTEEMTAAAMRQSRLNAAERILRIAVLDASGSPQAGHSRLALSTLLFEQKHASDALQFLQTQIESSARSVVETEAAFNLGKCLMMLNQTDEAVQAFLRSIDSSGGLTDVKIAAYIFHSRLLLEDNHGKRAIQSMMRGLSLSKGSQMEPFAALHLASLYLMLDNPQGANSVLMDRREELNRGPGREGAVFLSSLSRFRAAVLADRREREGAAVVAALSEFDPAKYCGGHWAILVAGACEDLGLSQESTDACLLALRRLPPCDLRNKTLLRLAARYQAENQPEEARQLLATLTSNEADQLSLQARLRSAELALEQNHPEDAILACRALIDSTEVPGIERAALRIMGQAFERQKNHHAAIYCFAGLLPDENADQAFATGGHK